MTRRVRLHARIAETLEQRYGEQAEAHRAELAHHQHVERAFEPRGHCRPDDHAASRQGQNDRLRGMKISQPPCELPAGVLAIVEHGRGRGPKGLRDA